MATINPMSNSLLRLLTEVQPGTDSKASGVAQSDFSNIFADALDTAAETDKADKASTLELLAGTSDDMSGMLLDSQKAEIALNLAIQMKNKVIDAYNEIMRMQV